MRILTLVLRNILRHKLRSLLTILGIAIAVMFFGVLRTVVDAWHSGVEGSANNRLVVRHAVSFIFPLPYAYRDQIARIPGVSRVTFANWFQGVYRDQNQFFARMAVDAETYMEIYPEFLILPGELEAFKTERNACVIGEKIAAQYGLKVGDIMPIEGDIYPGRYEFTVRGVYRPRDKTTDATQMLFHWASLDERLRRESPGRAGNVGWYIVAIRNPAEAARVAAAVDALFANSRAETKTETEAAFQQSFVSMSGAIITAMNFVSFVIIGVILLVLGNTMVMTTRERVREHAILKTIGFTRGHITGLIGGESLAIAGLGGGLGLLLMFPMVRGIASQIPSGMFPVFDVTDTTLLLGAATALGVGLGAAALPVWRAARTRIVDGLRQTG
ncbi:MAG: FtsX-like permease family protein [Bacteroidota bacterium]